MQIRTDASIFVVTQSSSLASIVAPAFKKLGVPVVCVAGSGAPSAALSMFLERLLQCASSYGRRIRFYCLTGYSPKGFEIYWTHRLRLSVGGVRDPPMRFLGICAETLRMLEPPPGMYKRLTRGDKARLDSLIARAEECGYTSDSAYAEMVFMRKLGHKIAAERVHMNTRVLVTNLVGLMRRDE